MSQESFGLSNRLDISRWLRQSPSQVRGKPVCATLMKFSPFQCTQKVRDKVRGLCRKVGEMEFGLNGAHKI